MAGCPGICVVNPLPFCLIVMLKPGRISYSPTWSMRATSCAAHATLSIKESRTVFRGVPSFLRASLVSPEAHQWPLACFRLENMGAVRLPFVPNRGVVLLP